MFQPLGRALAGLLLCASPLWVHAACSRPISAPMAPIGLSVFTGADGQLAGVYPDLLQRMNAQGSCLFQMAEVPRARQESLFENGKADILIPASYSPRRDKYGLFVPLVGRRATLISLQSDRKTIESARDLLAQPQIRVALVRGFDFGQAYLDLVAELTRQNRVVYDRDPLSVLRLIQGGIADMTIMAPSTLIGAMLGDPKLEKLVDGLRIEPVEEIPWDDSGVYLSYASLTAADRDALREQFERASRNGVVWKSFQRHYPAKALNGSIKPR